MGGQREIAKPLAYVIVTVGCILAMVTALAPLSTGSYKLSGVFLVLGIIPYIVYGTFTELLQSCTLISAGLVLLAVDFLARFGAQIEPVDMPVSPIPTAGCANSFAMVIPYSDLG